MSEGRGREARRARRQWGERRQNATATKRKRRLLLEENSQGPEDGAGHGRADEAEQHRADKLADQRDRELARAHALVVGLRF